MLDSADSPDSKNGRNLALRRLTVREYSTGEMRAYLERKGLDRAAAEATVRHLSMEGLIDDLRYVRAMVNHQIARGKGPAYVMAKLRQKGVSVGMDTVKAIYQESLTSDELDLARKTAERRYPDALSDPNKKRRAFQGLLRRGFSPDVVRRVLSG